MASSSLSRTILIYFALLSAAPAGATQFTAVYQVVRANQIVGEAREMLEIKGKQYHIESTVTPLGVVAIFVKETFKQVSDGQLSPTGFRPLSYSYERSQHSDKNISASFNWNTKIANFQYEGKIETQPLPPLLQDRLSLFYQFKYWPKNTPQLHIPMSNGKGISDYLIVRGTEETLSLPAGEFRATPYTRERTADDDGVSVWMSDKFPAPVKIVIDGKKGDHTEQVLVRVTQN